MTRRPGLMLATASLIVAFLITAAMLAAVLALPFSSSNRDIAVGDVFAAGIFLLALVAAVVAVLAYAESSSRPRLTTSWLFSADGETPLSDGLPRDDAADRHFAGRLPPFVRREDLVPLKPVELRLRVENDGDVAAKNVAVLILLEGIYFSPGPTLGPNAPWGIFPAGKGWKIQWEGGTDRPAYPGSIPRTPSVQLTGLWADPNDIPDEWGQVITFADGLKRPEMHPLLLRAASP